MSEQCDYIFEHTGNACLLPKGHPAGEHRWWAERPFQPQQEMVSLQAIRAALARMEENDAKLLAALNELHGSGPAWTQGFTTAQEQINKEVAGVLTTIKGSLDCIGGVLAELLAAKPPRKESKQPTYCQEHGPKGYICCKKLGHSGKHVADDGEKTLEAWPAPRRKSSRRKKGARK